MFGLKKSEFDEIVKNELHKVMDWFRVNQLLVNVSKTGYLFFGPNPNKVYIKGEYDLSELHVAAPQYLFETDDPEDPNHITVNKKGEFVLHDLHKVCPQYFISEYIETSDDDVIFEEDSVKYLGIHIDNKLVFKRHTALVTCKVNRLINTFWKMPNIGLDIKKVIYHSLVESHLNYGITIWASSFSKDASNNFDCAGVPDNLKNVKKAQNKIIRSILRQPRFNKTTQLYTEMSPLYKKLDVLKIRDLYWYNMGIICYEYFNNSEFPSKLKSKFCTRADNMARSSRSDKNNLDFRPPKLVGTYKNPV